MCPLQQVHFLNFPIPVTVTSALFFYKVLPYSDMRKGKKAAKLCLNVINSKLNLHNVLSLFQTS